MRKRRYEMQKCNDNKNILIWDNETGECLGFVAQIKGRLNLQDDIIKDQQATISRLEEENEQLKQKLEYLGLNGKNDTVKMIDGKAFIRM